MAGLLAANFGDVKMRAGMMWRWTTRDAGGMEEMQRGYELAQRNLLFDPVSLLPCHLQGAMLRGRSYAPFLHQGSSLSSSASTPSLKNRSKAK
jgi:hypothetical protein